MKVFNHPFWVMELAARPKGHSHRFTDLWALVAFAEAEHPELDLLTPPKRPEKK